MYKFKKFLTFTITWISSNLSIPFWVVGHVHLSVNIYDDIKEILASLGMNILVAIGFLIEWNKHKKEENEL
jgi:hypothetical protein